MSVHSFNYDSEYELPAPVIEITVYKAGQSVSRVVLSALIDSGADATMLPMTVLQTVGAPCRNAANAGCYRCGANG